jgi:hypothetical protein
MNCFEARRLLLAAPRERAAAHAGHVNQCASCARLAERLRGLDSSIADAASVPIPDGLADRILLPRVQRPRWQHYAAAAAVLLALGLGLIGPRLWDGFSLSAPVEAVGPTHPAVTAIAMVVEQQPTFIDEAHGFDLAAVEVDLKRLGLSLKREGVKVDYAGPCYMPDTACDHIVLSTDQGPVSVILVPDYPIGSRTLVADRRMAALVSPAGSGGYIVVAQSPGIAKRAEKLLVNG